MPIDLEFMQALLAERHLQYEQRFAAQQRAIAMALAAQKEATLLAEANAERWRMSANEWRGAMNDRERNFQPGRSCGGYLVGAVSLAGAIVVWLK
jgi:hypothetical protein